MIPNSPAYQHGRDDVDAVIVLSAPGRHEERAGHPAAGHTGRTLNGILRRLNRADPKRFPTADKDDYRIVNAVEVVHYAAKTGRTEGSTREVRDADNGRRLQEAVAGKGTILALGAKAQAALASAGITPTMIGSHPSMQNINRRYRSAGMSARARGEERLDRYARDVLATEGKLWDDPADVQARAGTRVARDTQSGRRPPSRSRS